MPPATPFIDKGKSMNNRRNACLAAALAALLSPAAFAASGPADMASSYASPAHGLGQPTAAHVEDSQAASGDDRLVVPASTAAPAPAAKTAPRTKVSTQIFVNASDLQRRWVSTADEGIAMDLKRFFIHVDHRFNEDWSARLTTDVQWQRNSDPTDLFIRHAYLQRRLGKSQHVRLGNAPTPWIGYAAQRNGFRYVDPGVTSRMRLGAPADWGVHGGGKLGQFNYAVAAVTGAGFQKPRTGKRADVEARVAWAPIANLEFALGGYQGTRAMDVNTSRLHTAKRWNGMVSYVDEKLRLGAEFFYADNWTRVIQASPDAARGWSAWSSYQLTPTVAMFSRHDHTEMSLRLNPTQEQRYSQLGMELRQSRHLRLALVGKRTDMQSVTRRAKANEIGVWAQVMF